MTLGNKTQILKNKEKALWELFICIFYMVTKKFLEKNQEIFISLFFNVYLGEPKDKSNILFILCGKDGQKLWDLTLIRIRYRKHPMIFDYYFVILSSDTMHTKSVIFFKDRAMRRNIYKSIAAIQYGKYHNERL